MTTIVVSSLLICGIIIATGFVFIWFDKDPTSVVTSGSDVFGKELGVCGFITIITRFLDSKDRKAEQRRKRKEEEDVTNG